MLHETVYLRPENEKVTLSTYVAYDSPELSMKPRPAMLVIPGGGYGFCSDREAEPIAKAFFAAGFNAFVLRYSVAPHALFPRPLEDASRAMVHIRRNAEKYNIDPERIFVVGFSAGGHLAASLGTMWHEDFAKASPDMESGENRPAGMILSYPVITGVGKTHRGSFINLLGTQTPSEEELRSVSLENRVDSRTVPAYIWHTVTDQAVPVENSLLMASAMVENGIPCEMHLFPHGPHGLSLANEETWSQNPQYLRPEVQQWIDEAIDWAKRI